MSSLEISKSDQRASAVDHRKVNHLTLQHNRTFPVHHGFFKAGNDLMGVRQLFGSWFERIPDHGNLPGMNAEDAV